jgi:purine-binding chemotaxis protein CheW
MSARPITASSAAVAVSPATAGEEQTQYLTFMVGQELFALGILAVREIIEYHKLTLVPMMPEAIRGVINLRGSVVPVVDLSARFGRPPSEVTKRTCIVIVELELDGDRQVVGVIVDAVNQVLDIPARDIEPPPTFGTKIRSHFIQGMGKVDGKFIVLLDAERVLSIEQVSALADVGRHALPAGT